MRKTIQSGEYGVGLAAPQIGESLSLAVVAIRPTPSHPGRKKLDKVIINPEYVGIGKLIPMWEGCMSLGSEQPLFAQVKRYEKVKASYLDETGKPHEEELDGFLSHVFQHETDHLKGVLFVDKIADSKSWMTAYEYKKRIKNKPD